jgi:hypothetical protein
MLRDWGVGFPIFCLWFHGLYIVHRVKFEVNMTR